MTRLWRLLRAILPILAVCLDLSAATCAGGPPSQGPDGRVYAVGDLVAAENPQEASQGAVALAAVVRRCALAGADETAVSPVEVSGKHALVVRADEEGHRAVAELLQKLRRAIQANPGETPKPAAEDKLAKALATRVDFVFLEVPLGQVADLTGRQHGIEIKLDAGALAAIGVTPQTEISVALKGVSLRSALCVALRELDLICMVRDGSLVITTPPADADEDEAATRLSAAVYPVAGLVGEDGNWTEADLKFIEQLITSAIQPTAWEDVGGAGRIARLSPGKQRLLVVLQTPDVHEEIHDLLAVLRRLVADAEAGRITEPLSPGEDPSPGNRRVEEALTRPFSCDYRKTPLEDVAADILKRTGVNVVLDGKALKDIGIGTDTPVTLRVANISLRSALRHLLRRLDLTWCIQNEVLLVTTPEEAEARLRARFYPVPDLVNIRDSQGKPSCDFKPLINLVTSTIKPTTWDEVGGPGSIAAGALAKARFLAVSQTRDAHEEIAVLLAVLRRVARESAGGNVPEPVMLDEREVTEATRAIRKALESRFSFEFVEKPLEEALAEIARKARINILVDPRALDDLGIGTDTPITKSAKDADLRSFLRLMLRGLDLTCIIHDEVLLVTTLAADEPWPLVGLYPVRDLVETRDPSGKARCDYKGLVDLVSRTVHPTSWDAAGGPGSIGVAPFENVQALVITQTPAVHDDVRRLLNTLRKVASLTVQDPKLGEKRPYFLVSGADETPAHKAIRAALESTVDVDFVEMPLADVIHHFRDRFKIDIQVDTKALDVVGIGADTPVTIRLKNVTFRSALSHVLRPLGLTFDIQQRVLLVTASGQLEWRLDVAVCPVGDLAAGRGKSAQVERDFDSLIDVIVRAVRPTCWDDFERAASVVPFSHGTLRVVVSRQTWQAHEEIARLLADLRACPVADPARRTPVTRCVTSGGLYTGVPAP